MAAPGDLPTFAGGRLIVGTVAPGRLHTLIDGIFAIALTLLVLDLRPPDASIQDPGAYGAALWAIAPHFVAFVAGFGVLGVCWVVQHNLFRAIRRVDHGVLWLTILFLLWISVIPFTTALLGRHPGQQLAVVLHTLNLIVVWLSLWCVWRRALAAPHLLDPGLQPEVARLIGRLPLIPVALYAIALAISFASVLTSYVLLVLAPLGLIAAIRLRAR